MYAGRIRENHSVVKITVLWKEKNIEILKTCPRHVPNIIDGNVQKTTIVIQFNEQTRAIITKIPGTAEPKGLKYVWRLNVMDINDANYVALRPVGRVTTPRQMIRKMKTIEITPVTNRTSKKQKEVHK
ncbi:unnamed protein product, partial [Didymodactylos carnosus]